MNLILAILLVGLFLYGTFSWLDSYTHHGEKLPLPDLSNKTLADAIKTLEDSNLRYDIVDSVYSENVLPGMVVSQVPSPYFINPETGEQENYKVKENRTVYLTINKLSPPKVSVPEFTGVSKRIAISRLKTMGLNVELVYESNNVCDDCVIGTKYRGRSLNAGEKIERGSTVTVVLGRRSNRTVTTPNLVGLKVVNASTKLNNKSLNLGSITGECDGCHSKYDTLNAVIIRQSPNAKDIVNRGEEINVVISTNDSETP